MRTDLTIEEADRINFKSMMVPVYYRNKKEKLANMIVKKSCIEEDFGQMGFIQAVLEYYNCSYDFNPANTGSWYWDCECGSNNFKIRLADHMQCYDCDINLNCIDGKNYDGVDVREFEEVLLNYLRKRK